MTLILAAETDHDDWAVEEHDSAEGAEAMVNQLIINGWKHIRVFEAQELKIVPVDVVKRIKLEKKS